MEKKPRNPSSEPVTKADLNALKAEIIEAVQATVKGLATKDDLKTLAPRETVNAVMETVAETKENVTELMGLMKDVVQELTTTHEDVRYLRRSMDMLVRNDAAQDTAIKTLTARVARLERKVGITK
jgi:chaperonin cofactor prefoldin